MGRWQGRETATATSTVSPTTGGTAWYTRAPRLLLFPLTMVLQLMASAAGGIGFVSGSPPWLMVGGAVLWLGWFGGLFWIAREKGKAFSREATTKFKKIGVATLVLLVITGVGELAFVTAYEAGLNFSGLLKDLNHVFMYNDATALCHQAARNVLEGKNPYENGNIVLAIQQYVGASDRITPRREGLLVSVFPYPSPAELDAVWQKAVADPAHPPPEIETRMNYPAGAFLLPAPFIWLGIKDIRWVYLLYVLPALAAVVWITPRKQRWLLALVLLVGLAFWNSIAGGETGSLAFPFMLLGWALARKHPLPSALFMGIAVATKQTAFFLVPFYLVLMYRTDGFKRALSAGSIMAAVFFALNAPFIVDNPGLWINSMGAPMSNDFFPLGAGLITVVTSGLVTIRSPMLFTLMEGVVLGLGLVWYIANCRRYPHTGPILAFLPLFFAWRSLWSYFFYIDVIVLASLVIDPNQAEPDTAAHTLSPGRIP